MASHHHVKDDLKMKLQDTTIFAQSFVACLVVHAFYQCLGAGTHEFMVPFVVVAPVSPKHEPI